jgi:hypothetical protein
MSKGASIGQLTAKIEPAHKAESFTQCNRVTGVQPPSQLEGRRFVQQKLSTPSRNIRRRQEKNPMRSEDYFHWSFSACLQQSIWVTLREIVLHASAADD